MTTTKQKPSSVPAALNVYKKVAIIRNSDDVLTYEDIGGTLKTVTDLHLAAVATVSLGSNKLSSFLFTYFYSIFNYLL